MENQDTEFYEIIEQPSGWPTFTDQCMAYRRQLAAFNADVRATATRLCKEKGE